MATSSLLPTSGNPSSLLRRACWDTLPRELKLKVCKLAKEADGELANMRFDHVKSRDWDRVHDLVGEHEWYGKSLKALRMVDRELRALASPMFFETISLKTMTKPYFRTHISPNYSHFFKTLELSACWPPIEIPALEHILSLLHFYHLEHLQIDRKTFRVLFPTTTANIPCQSDTEITTSFSFQRLAGNVRSLTVIDIDAEELVNTLPSFTRIRRLEIISEKHSHKALDFSLRIDFFPALLQLPELVDLAFISRREAGDFYAPPLPPSFSPLPALRCLQLSIYSIVADDWKSLISIPTLEHLDLDLLTVVVDAPSLNLLPPSLRIRRFSLSASFRIIFQLILPSLVNVPLTHLKLCARPQYADSWEVPPSPVIPTFFDSWAPTLRYLSFSQIELIQEEEDVAGVERALHELRNEHQHIVCEMNLGSGMAWREYGINPDDFELRDETSLRHFDALEEAQDFLGVLTKDLRATMDVEGAKLVLEQLQGLRAISILKKL